MNLWAHQQRALDLVDAAIGAGQRKIVVTIPTGGGKTLVMQTLAQGFLERKSKVVMYTNRRLLREQTSAVMMDAGIYHGVRAAGEDDERDHPFQISSIQTEHSRVVKQRRWELHAADLVLVDEAHMQKENMAVEILNRHIAAGAVVVGFTATPLDLGDFYEHLIIAATTSELRKCGALVPAIHYAPDEPDMRSFKKLSSDKDDLKVSENDVKKAMGPRPQLWGRVWANFEQLNPEHRATILFAPGVEESIWFAQQFCEKSVKAAHLDGDDVWMDGYFHKSTPELRAEVLDASKTGRIRVLCNRFVLREGIDAPWLSHGIFATVFGSVQSYLQSGGRLLRAFSGMDSVTVQDHGGNWWRHGSLNDDREWFLEQTQDMAYGLRSARIREGKKSQPFRCPQCGRTWTRGRACLTAHGGCGFELPPKAKFARPVVTAEGDLREMIGEVFRKRRICQKPDAIKRWTDLILYRCRAGTKGSRTFRQAAACYAMDNEWAWPAPWWPLMPINERDWWLLVEEVPRERLRDFARQTG